MNYESPIMERDGVRYPRVSTILKETGIVDTTWYSIEGAERGTTIHSLTIALDSGIFTKDELPDEYYGYLSAYLDFLQQNRVEILETELEVIHKGKNPYIGHIDKIVIVNGKEYIIDIKTGAISDWYGFQLAAYRMAYNKKINCALLQIRKDGKYRFIVSSGGRAFNNPYWEIEWKMILRKYYEEVI